MRKRLECNTKVIDDYEDSSLMPTSQGVKALKYWRKEQNYGDFAPVKRIALVAMDEDFDEHASPPPKVLNEGSKLITSMMKDGADDDSIVEEWIKKKR